MLAVVRVKVIREKAFNRPRELAVEPVDENRFEYSSLEDEIRLACGRISRTCCEAYRVIVLLPLRRRIVAGRQRLRLRRRCWALEWHRGHLRIDDYYVKVLTLKEPSAQSFPLILKRLLEVEANFYVVSEWKKEDSGKTRRTIQAKRRHFHNTKRSFFSQVNMNDAAPQDALFDDSKESQVEVVNYFGHFSLTVVIYDLDL